MTTKNGTVIYRVENEIATITMNRPEVKNAINVAMHEDLQEAFLAAKDDPSVKVIILQGIDGAFSSGADLKSIPIHDFQSFDHGDYLADTYNKLINIIASIDKPTIANINGVAFGAGLSIALACDFRWASHDAKFAISFLKIGLVPDAGASYYLPRIVGLQKAIEFALGEPLTAEEALRYGLINNIGDHNDFATELTKVPTKAFGLMKRNMYQSYDRSLTEVLESEVDAQRKAGKTKEHLAAVMAFVQKAK